MKGMGIMCFRKVRKSKIRVGSSPKFGWRYLFK